jgi:DNA-binding beta-propeller fold protein YncE
MLLCDRDGDRILMYDIGTGEYLGISTDEATSGFDTPVGIAMLGRWVYVSATTNQIIVRYAIDDPTEHEVLLSFPDAGFPGLVNPRDLEVGPDGRVYIAVEGDRSTGNGVILVYDPELDSIGTFADFHGTVPESSQDGLLSPMDLAFGPDGHLFVTNRRTLVQPVMPGNNVLRFTGPLDPNPGIPLPAPGNSGALYALSPNNALPNALTFGPDRDGDDEVDLYVSRNEDDRLVVLSGPLGATPGANLGPFLATSLNRPWGLGWLNGELYVAAFSANQVQVYDQNGVFLRILAPTGDEPPDPLSGLPLKEPIEFVFAPEPAVVPTLTNPGIALLVVIILMLTTHLLRRRGFPA